MCVCVWVGGVGQRCQPWGHTAQCNSMKWSLLCQWGCPLCTAPLFSRSSNPGQFLNRVWQWAGWVTTETDTEPVHSAFMDVYALAYPEKGKQNLWGKKREDAESVFKAAEGKNWMEKSKCLISIKHNTGLQQSILHWHCWWAWVVDGQMNALLKNVINIMRKKTVNVLLNFTLGNTKVSWRNKYLSANVRSELTTVKEQITDQIM